MLYASFRVIPLRLNFICERFGTHCLFHLHRRVGVKMEQTVCSEKLIYKIQTPGNYSEESIQNSNYLILSLQVLINQQNAAWIIK